MDLKKLADEIDDITDPTAIEKVLFHIHQIQEDDDEFMQLLIETCKDEIVLWEQPWYQLSSCLTRRLQETNENETEQYKTDAITKKEDKKIRKNWQKFIEEYNLPDKLVSYARWRNKHGCRNPKALQEKVRRYVAAYLARGLKRTIYQVYKYVMTHTGENVKKQYTPEEEKIMQVCFHHDPDKAVTYLSTILCREPRGIYKRLAYINKGKPPRKRMSWTLDQATQFLHSLMKHTGMTLDELKCKTFDLSVWLKIQDDMDHSYMYLKQFWYKYLHPQLFIQHDVKLNKLRKKIFKLIRSYPYKVWSDIRWKELVNDLPDGYTHMFIYSICSSVVRFHPNYLTIPLEDIIEYALAKIKKSCYKERRLRTLKLNNQGQLEQVKYLKEEIKEDI